MAFKQLKQNGREMHRILEKLLLKNLQPFVEFI